MIKIGFENQKLNLKFQNAPVEVLLDGEVLIPYNENLPRRSNLKAEIKSVDDFLSKREETLLARMLEKKLEERASIIPLEPSEIVQEALWELEGEFKPVQKIEKTTLNKVSLDLTRKIFIPINSTDIRIDIFKIKATAIYDENKCIVDIEEFDVVLKRFKGENEIYTRNLQNEKEAFKRGLCKALQKYNNPSIETILMSFYEEIGR